MAPVTAQMVKELRGRTDLPMMECKQALTESGGAMEAALEWLRKRHKGKLAERSDKATGEGCIGVYMDESRKIGALVELQCETAPVAKNELFTALARAFAKKVAGGTEASPDPEVLRQDPVLEEMFTDVFGKMRENMKLSRCRRVEGEYLASYIHHDGKSGILLALDSEPKSDKPVAADLCMHTIFTDPLAIDVSGVSEEEVEKIRERARERAKEEGKPEQIIEKIVTGKVNAFYAERVLMEQIHVKTDEYAKTKIRDVLKQAEVNAVTGFVILRIGG